jgi:hypothetical protein
VPGSLNDGDGSETGDLDHPVLGRINIGLLDLDLIGTRSGSVVPLGNHSA